MFSLIKFYPLGDGMEYSNNMEFSAYDADHDKFGGNCASDRGGGFWWERCGWQNVNGPYNESNYSGFRLNSMWWDDHYNLKKTRLMIRPAA